MGLVPPHFIPPQVSLPAWYAIWLDDGVTSQRYDTSTYATKQEALFVCEALQEAYSRLLYDCTFTPCLRSKGWCEDDPIPSDPALIDNPFAFDPRLMQTAKWDKSKASTAFIPLLCLSLIIILVLVIVVLQSYVVIR